MSKMLKELTFVGSPEGSGYISKFSFSVEKRLVKCLTTSAKSFPTSFVAKRRLDVQKNAWAIADEDDKSQNSSCSITWPLIWLRVNWELTLIIKSPPIPARKDLGFPLIVHLMLRTLVDSIPISCTDCNNKIER